MYAMYCCASNELNQASKSGLDMPTTECIIFPGTTSAVLPFPPCGYISTVWGIRSRELTSSAIVALLYNLGQANEHEVKQRSGTVINGGMFDSVVIGQCWQVCSFSSVPGIASSVNVRDISHPNIIAVCTRNPGLYSVCVVPLLVFIHDTTSRVSGLVLTIWYSSAL